MNIHRLCFLIITSTFLLTTVKANADPLASTEEKNLREFSQVSKEPGAVMFTPPPNWQLADAKALPSSVKIMVVGKGESDFPPSINLATENYAGTLKQYLKQVKAINSSQGNEWKDLGTIRTDAGDASYSQAIVKTQWGDVKLMHVIFLKNGIIYILTGAALKDDFPKYYKDFFNSFRSLKINQNVYEMVADPSKRANLENAQANLIKSFSVLSKRQDQSSSTEQSRVIFNSEQFQKNYWEPFKRMLSKDYGEMGSEWQNHLLDKIQNEITE